jgi:hypothetical protein
LKKKVFWLTLFLPPMMRFINFWSKSEKVQEQSLEKLTNVNYITGENGSGKKAFLSFVYSRNQGKSLFLSAEEINHCLEEGGRLPQVPQKVDFVLIDNPENNLSTSNQKAVPRWLQKISKVYGVQVFVSTNSPFIIAASARITEQEKLDCECDGKEFYPRHKVYVLKDGEIADRRGLVNIDFENKPKGRFGYWGKKASLIASQMLSRGLMEEDQEEFSPSSNSPILVICEGEYTEADALIYNRIFESYQGRSVLFVSSQGTSQVSMSFDIFRQIKNSMSADFKLMMLRDRDHEFADESEIEKYEKTYPGRRVLRRRAIECYVYNSETADLLLKSVGSFLYREDKERMDKLQEKIESEARDGVMGNSYKDRLKEMFEHITKAYAPEMLRRQNSDPSFRLSVDVLAKLVKPGTKTYEELSSAIFGGLIDNSGV